MFNNWKQRLISDWNLMRIIRLVLGIMVLVEGLNNANPLALMLGLLLLSQALLNVGCCGTQGCSTDSTTPRTPLSEEDKNKITFEEIK